MPRLPSTVLDTRFRFLIPLAGALLLAAAAYKALPAGAAVPGLWRKWGMILVRQGPGVPEAVRALEGSGISPVWSEASQTVYLTDFVSSRRVGLEEALRRVLPGDPRRTPWLEGLSNFFRTGDGSLEWSILYIPASSESRAARVLSRSLAKGDWMRPGRGGAGTIRLLWLPGAALAAYYAYRFRRIRWLALAASIPWLPLWITGSAAALGGVWGYFALLNLAAENDTDPGHILLPLPRSTAVRLLPPAITLVLLAVNDIPSLPGLGASVLSGGCFALGLERLHRWKAERRLHRVFEGIPLDTAMHGKDLYERRRSRMLAALAASLAVLTIQAVPPAFRSAAAGSGRGLPPLPVPGSRIAAGTLDAESVELVLGGRTEPGLPSLADAVAHRAYQEALPYSRIGSRAYGSLEPAVLERFSPQGPSVLRVRENAAEFDDSWVRATLKEETDSGIGAVLADQRGIVHPRILSPEEAGMPGSLALRDVFFYIILLVPAVLGTAWMDLRRSIPPARIARGAPRR